MTERIQHQLALFGAHLTSRRDKLLDAVFAAALLDPAQTTVSSLSRAQFKDHIPTVLDAFAKRLQLDQRVLDEAAADARRNRDEIKHGLHRWQQGYRLRELLHEWGHLHLCLADELESFARAHPELDRATIVEANRQLIILVNEAVSESAGQYARLQQDEAAGHLKDLQRIVAETRELEQRRAALIHQAVHDLRGNVQSVSSAAEILREDGIGEAERRQFIDLLQQGADAVSGMMNRLMDLARLEAGQERREIAPFDAAALLRDFCDVNQPLSRDRNLFLRFEGPSSLPVEGDEGKVRRILQNLALNALKYTETGGVTVTAGLQEPDTWWFAIKDTGPGLMAGPGSPMAADLKAATATAHEAHKPAGSPADPARIRLPARQQSGEGIGLSIVKRLCELLDASLELTSSAEHGTEVRVVLPLSYSPDPELR